jgi:cbb3-type cytochrome oxidase subunit 3
MNACGNRERAVEMMILIMWLQHNSILLVFAVFVLILLTTYWPGRRSIVEQHGRIPLDDDR